MCEQARANVLPRGLLLPCFGYEVSVAGVLPYLNHNLR